LLEPYLIQRKIIASKLRAAGNDNVELVADPDAAWRSMYFDKRTGSRNWNL